ncbi:hypothetical protein L7F22_016256 [Adiantum nelumboides]|nr:hypothetical protein [Adiantum nelumboides]
MVGLCHGFPYTIFHECEEIQSERAEKVIASLGIPINKVCECMGNLNYDTSNPLLKSKQDAQVGQGAQGDVTILPTLIINDTQYRGKLDKGAKVQERTDFKKEIGGALHGSSPGYGPNMNGSFGGDSHQRAIGYGSTRGNGGSNYGLGGIDHDVQKGGQDDNERLQERLESMSTNVVGNIIGFALVYNGADGIIWAIAFEIGRALHAEIDIVSKAAIFSAFIEQEQDEKALQSYCKFSQKEIGSNHQTFLMALQACGKLTKEEGCMLKAGGFVKANSLEIGRAIHVDAEARGLDTSLFVANTLISMYDKCGAIIEANIIFEKFAHTDIIAWNMLSYVEEGKVDDVLRLYRQKREEGFELDRQTFFTILQACDDVAIKMSNNLNGNAVKRCARSFFSSDVGIALHADIRRRGLALDVFVGKLSSLIQAESVFCGLSCIDLISYTTMLSIFIAQGEEDQVLSLFNNMQEKGLVRDEITVVGVLQACWKTGRLDIENENKGTCKGKKDSDGTLQNDDSGMETSKDGEIVSCEGHSERKISKCEEVIMSQKDSMQTQPSLDPRIIKMELQMAEGNGSEAYQGNQASDMLQSVMGALGTEHTLEATTAQGIIL